jgi:hypothetical protein
MRVLKVPEMPDTRELDELASEYLSACYVLGVI